jgi:prepilin-type N-terminal cleavage/methylation domain-containing protein
MKDAGFSLLEVLIAVAIFALGSQALVWIFSEQSAGLTRAERLQYATAMAASTFDRVGQDIPLQPAQLRGAWLTGMDWELKIAPYQAPPAGSVARLYRVEMVVTDQAARRPLLELSTLRLAMVQP